MNICKQPYHSTGRSGNNNSTSKHDSSFINNGTDKSFTNLRYAVFGKFEDEAEETLMFLKVDPDMNFDSISKLIIGDVKKVRKEKSNDLDKLMNFVGSLPRPFLEAFFGTLKVLEYHGIMPKGLTAGDPNYSSVLLSNLGSIRSDSCYHHLSNYGTCSVMITIGVLHKEQKLMDDGTWQERDVINCTFTIDERLADGFYFAKSLRIAKYMLEHPEVMNEPISRPVPVEMKKKKKSIRSTEKGH